MNRTPARKLAPVLGVAIGLGLVGCQASESTEAAPSSIDTVAGNITLPDGAWDAATEAAAQCDEITPELIAGVIATVSGYDAQYSDGSGREGYAAMPPVQWDSFGTGDNDDRADIHAATTAVGAQLCDAHTSARDLAENPDDDTEVEDLALAITLVGKSYVEREGIADVDDAHDPHLVRTQITDIQHATASVAQAPSEGES